MNNTVGPYEVYRGQEKIGDLPIGNEYVPRNGEGITINNGEQQFVGFVHRVCRSYTRDGENWNMRLMIFVDFHPPL